jgi:hypothetical protein
MALGLLSLISTRAPALDAAAGASSIGEWEAAWTKVLTRHVDDSGRMDFDSLRRNHAHLDLVVAFVAAVDPITQPRQFPERYSRLAFYINAYNALAMYGVVQAGVPESLGGLRKFAFFYLRTFAVGGKSISLSKFENDVIRPLSDERIHFALNCMNGRTHLHRGLSKRLDRARQPRGLAVGYLRFLYRGFSRTRPEFDCLHQSLSEAPIPADFNVRFLEYHWTVNHRKWAY